MQPAFGQIVKAAEPVFSAVVNTVFYGKSPSISKWLILPIIVGGVAISTLKPKPGGGYDIDFDTTALIAGSIGNMFAAFKGSENHKAMEKPGLKASQPYTHPQGSTLDIVQVASTQLWVPSRAQAAACYGRHVKGNVFGSRDKSGNALWLRRPALSLAFLTCEEHPSRTNKKLVLPSLIGSHRRRWKSVCSDQCAFPHLSRATHASL
eukprot:scaffold178244_cov37-Tisochrysis_lutea.AAC.2